MKNRINTFSSHYRKKYGKPVGKIPLDTGYICPNRERGGCIFCRPESFSPPHLRGDDSLHEQVRLGKNKLPQGRTSLYFGYFQQETCTAAPTDWLLHCTKQLLQDQQCIGVIFSTRPDCIEAEFLSPLANLIHTSGKECHFELGLQSTHERSLVMLNRNHTVKDFVTALRLLKSYEIFLTGAHLIFGLPGESEEDMMDSVQYVNSLKIDTLKLHHLQVIRETALEKTYHAEKFALYRKDEYIQLLLRLLPIIPSTTIIHRLWSHSHPHLLVAPKWNILPGILSAELFRRMEQLTLYQGCRL